MKKIGILLPQSKNFPRMGKEFLNGLTLALENNLDFEFKIEGIGFGTNPNVIIDAIQKLVNQERVAITTGLLGHKGISEIYNFVESIDETFIYADIGGTIPLSLKDKKNIFCNSLDLCQSAYLLGKYFCTNDFKKIGTSSCYYDVGYDIIEALDTGMSNLNTTFSGHFITPLNPRNNEADLMTDFFEENKPDAIFGFHNGIYAKEHATYIKKNKINQSIPLYTTYFSTDDDIIQDNLTDFEGIKSISTWFPELETEENKFFIANYTKEYGKKPSVFSLLGYENGLLLKSYFNKQNLYELETKGPRGNMSISKATNRTNFNHYIYEITDKDNFGFRKTISTLNNEEKKLIKDTIEEKISGWHNAYLCH